MYWNEGNAMRLACVGNALYDIISFVETDFASSLGYHAGSTVHAGIEDVEPIIAALPNAARCAGGGAVNAARVFASLGFESSFAGMIGGDETGTCSGPTCRSRALPGSFSNHRGRPGSSAR